VSLLTIGEGGNWSFVSSPIDPAGRNGGTYQTELTVRADGSTTGTRRLDAVGLYNVSLRNAYENRGKIKERLEASLGGRFPGSSVNSWEVSDLDTVDENEWVRFEFSIPEYARRSGDEVSFQPILFPFEFSRSYAVLDERRRDLVIDDGLATRWFREQTAIVHIPEGYRPVSVPEAARLETPFGKAETEWSVRGTEIEHKCRIEWQAVRVTPREYPKFREFCRELDRIEQERVVLVKSVGVGEKQE
jgi:hypothetical protein